MLLGFLALRMVLAKHRVNLQKKIGRSMKLRLLGKRLWLRA
ncbi:hypothetical protein ACJIZ3_018213 [Penstemon smallii]|uniref:Uncharacterized protein n=1 Tax=Penstemon smallii TaxID=265156 RepID=A0ABD3SYB8_9LAMI